MSTELHWLLNEADALEARLTYYRALAHSPGYSLCKPFRIFIAKAAKLSPERYLATIEG